MRHRKKVWKFEENKEYRDEKNLGYKIYSKKNGNEESKNKNKREEKEVQNEGSQEKE